MPYPNIDLNTIVMNRYVVLISNSDLSTAACVAFLQSDYTYHVITSPMSLSRFDHTNVKIGYLSNTSKLKHIRDRITTRELHVILITEN
jgi:hypothetical protein